jgi:hypothetical protein
MQLAKRGRCASCIPCIFQAADGLLNTANKFGAIIMYYVLKHLYGILKSAHWYFLIFVLRLRRFELMLCLLRATSHPPG